MIPERENFVRNPHWGAARTAAISIHRSVEPMKEKMKKIVQFFANPRLLLCLAVGWIITNGWSYIMLAVGTWLGIGWMIAVASAYLAFLWMPISPEKIVTVAIAMALLRFLFPEDQKTLGVLKNLYAKVKQTVSKKDTEPWEET
jgi:hypothetical protein